MTLYTTQVEFTVTFVQDAVRDDDTVDHDRIQRLIDKFNTMVRRFTEENGEELKVPCLAVHPVVNWTKVPRSRRRNNRMFMRNKWTIDELLELWNNDASRISLYEGRRNEKEHVNRLRRMAPAVIDVKQQMYSSSKEAILPPVDLQWFADNDVLSQIHNHLAEIQHTAIRNKLIEIMDAWFDGEIEDGLIATLREARITEPIQQFLNAEPNDTSCSQEPF